MRYAALITMVLIIIGALQLFPLIKKKLTREIYISITLLCIALIYCYSNIFQWNLPGPWNLINDTFNSISQAIFNYSSN
jgi:hypothetical protein